MSDRVRAASAASAGRLRRRYSSMLREQLAVGTISAKEYAHLKEMPPPPTPDGLYDATNVDASYKSRLLAFYQEHAPKKQNLVDALLQVHKGKEKRLLARLEEKYDHKDWAGNVRILDDDPEDGIFPSVLTGIKTLYERYILPLEERHDYCDFNAATTVRGADFEAAPMVLLCGQYSTGKTTFIRYLIGRDFPGQRIGPEPTTDKFVAVMNGRDERVIPGNALSMMGDRPFTSTANFGTGFLNRFECAQVPDSPLLKQISMIDSPGILSGKKQRDHRGYDFCRVIGWFAGRCDRILLLFDAHKLDISDEFKAALEEIKIHDDKVRIVLNKADSVTSQQLMRVYGAMMWGLGKVMGTPEVPRVYISSFRDAKYKIPDQKKFFDAEKRSLMADLLSLPRNSMMRRINDLAKRARAVKVHALLASYLRKQIPSMFGKKKKQDELLEILPEVFNNVMKMHGLAFGDFPDWRRFRRRLSTLDDWRSDLKSLKPRMLENMDEMLTSRLPKLMKQLPPIQGGAAVDAAAAAALAATRRPSNPFKRGGGGGGSGALSPLLKALGMTTAFKRASDEIFFGLPGANPAIPGAVGRVSGANAKDALVEFAAGRVDTSLLFQVWQLADNAGDGRLDAVEFATALFFIDQLGAGKSVAELRQQMMALASSSA